MSNFTIQLDSEAIREATVQAISGFLSPEIRERIIREAIENLLKPSTNSWDRGKSMLERAFEKAAESVAFIEAERLVKEDEIFANQIKDLLRKTADKMIGVDSEELSERMARALIESLRGK